MKIFKDRESAGKLLADHLKQYKSKPNTIVLAIPRGGVVVASEVARELKLPLDIIITRKIGAPGQPELAIGAVDADGEVIWDHKLLAQLKLKIDPDLIGVENLKLKIEDGMNEIKRREKLYRSGKESLDVENKTVIIIDDGIATGATILSAVNYLKHHEAGKIILAVPLASKDSVEKVKREVMEVVVLEIPENFQSVGQFYYKFEAVEDEEVIQLTTQLSSPRRRGSIK